MVDGLLEVIGGADTNDMASVVQTALLNLEILSHSFAEGHPAAFVKVLGGEAAIKLSVDLL